MQTHLISRISYIVINYLPSDNNDKITDLTIMIFSLLSEIVCHV